MCVCILGCHQKPNYATRARWRFFCTQNIQVPISTFQSYFLYEQLVECIRFNEFYNEKKAFYFREQNKHDSSAKIWKKNVLFACMTLLSWINLKAKCCVLFTSYWSSGAMWYHAHFACISLYLTDHNNILIYVDAFSGDTLLANGIQRRKSNGGVISNDNGTFTVDIEKNFAAEIVDILEDDGQIALPLTDESNQSSMKKVSDTTRFRPRCDGFYYAFYSILFLSPWVQIVSGVIWMDAKKWKKKWSIINNSKTISKLWLFRRHFSSLYELCSFKCGLFFLSHFFCFSFLPYSAWKTYRYNQEHKNKPWWNKIKRNTIHLYMFSSRSVNRDAC